MSPETWQQVRERYEAARERDETFSAWVRRKLVAA